MISFFFHNTAIFQSPEAPKDEAHRNSRHNLGKTNFMGLQKFFEEVEWREFRETKYTKRSGKSR